MTNPTPPIEYDVLTVQGMQDVLDASEQQRAATQAAEADARAAITLMQAAGAVRSLGRAPQAGDPAGTYRVVEPAGDVVDVAWNGAAETARTPALASAAMLDRLTAGTLTELRALPPGAARHVVVLGHATPGDWGPPRIARWVAGSGEADDNGMRIRPTLGGGCWAFAADMAGFVHSRWYNLDPDGLTDLAPKINAILARFDLMLDLHPDLDLDPGGAARALYRIDSTVTVTRPRRLWGAYAHNRSVVLDASRLTGGSVGLKVPTTVADGGQTADHDYCTIIKHFELRGAGKDAQGNYQNAYGLQRSGCLYRIEHLVIAGFLVGEHVQANQTYITDMVDCIITTNGTNVLYDSVAGGVNSGEKLTYTGGYIGGGNVGMNIADGWEITLRNVSLDYNHQQLALSGLSSVTFVAGHIEWDSGTPLVLMGPQYTADVVLRDVTFLRIEHDAQGNQRAVFPLRREYLLDNEYSGLGGNRGSIQGTVHSGKNGTQAFAFTAKALSNTLYELANYLNDNSVPLLITWVLEFNPDNGTGAVFNAYVDPDSLTDGQGGVRGNARRVAEELVPFGTPAGTKRVVRQHVPAGMYFSFQKNNYVNVVNVRVETA